MILIKCIHAVLDITHTRLRKAKFLACKLHSLRDFVRCQLSSFIMVIHLEDSSTLGIYPLFWHLVRVNHFVLAPIFLTVFMLLVSAIVHVSGAQTESLAPHLRLGAVGHALAAHWRLTVGHPWLLAVRLGLRLAVGLGLTVLRLTVLGLPILGLLAVWLLGHPPHRLLIVLRPSETSLSLGRVASRLLVVIMAVVVTVVSVAIVSIVFVTSEDMLGLLVGLVELFYFVAEPFELV